MNTGTTSTSAGYTIQIDTGGHALYQPTLTYTGWDSPAGTGFKLSSKAEGIGPSLLFRFIRSKFKMNAYQEKKHKARLQKLGKLVREAKELKQQAMYEELSRILAITIRESELLAFGINRWVERKFIDQFLDKVKDKVVYLKEFSEFPRPVPGNVRQRIKVLTEANVFDELWILYIDYTKQDLKTNEKKVREKDPILFGRFTYNPDVFYYITDWVDEYCDLTLESVVEKMKSSDSVYQVQDIPEMDEKYFEVIKKEVALRTERLAQTRASNFVSLGQQAAAEAKAPPVWKLGWLSRLMWWKR